MKETKCILQEAKAAVSSLAVLKSEEKNKALLAMADALIADTSRSEERRVGKEC